LLSVLTGIVGSVVAMISVPLSPAPRSGRLRRA
jgi:hypothetical protein